MQTIYLIFPSVALHALEETEQFNFSHLTTEITIGLKTKLSHCLVVLRGAYPHLHTQISNRIIKFHRVQSPRTVPVVLQKCQIDFASKKLVTIDSPAHTVPLIWITIVAHSLVPEYSISPALASHPLISEALTSHPLISEALTSHPLISETLISETSISPTLTSHSLIPKTLIPKALIPKTLIPKTLISKTLISIALVISPSSLIATSTETVSTAVIHHIFEGPQKFHSVATAIAVGVHFVHEFFGLMPCDSVRIPHALEQIIEEMLQLMNTQVSIPIPIVSIEEDVDLVLSLAVWNVEHERILIQMGQNSSAVLFLKTKKMGLTPLPDEYKEVQLHRYCHPSITQTLTCYSIMINSVEQLEFTEHLNLRRAHPDLFPQIIHGEVVFLSKDYMKIELYLETVLLTTEKIFGLQFQDALAVIYNAAKGFNALYSKGIKLQINSRMIGFTENGQAKVWLHQKFTRFRQKRSFEYEQHMHPEQCMVEGLVTIFYSIVDTTTIPKQFNLAYIKYFSLLNEYLQMYGKDITNRIEAIVQFYQKNAIALDFASQHSSEKSTNQQFEVENQSSRKESRLTIDNRSDVKESQKLCYPIESATPMQRKVGNGVVQFKHSGTPRISFSKPRVVPRISFKK